MRVKDQPSGGGERVKSKRRSVSEKKKNRKHEKYNESGVYHKLETKLPKTEQKGKRGKV